MDADAAQELVAQLYRSVEVNGGVLQDMWIDYRGERWYPVVVRDRTSGKAGFDVNFAGKWGPGSEVGRRKLLLGELLEALAAESIPNDATIRCMTIGGAQRNGRRVSGLRYSSSLGHLIAGLRAARKKKQGA